LNACRSSFGDSTAQFVVFEIDRRCCSTPLKAERERGIEIRII
jgi:hypothetical protein